jgi:predicted DNA-binding protein (MmcQ/YjbR family)
VRGKIFVFLGAGKDGFGMSVKLPATHELALTRKGTRPTPYGLGKAGWVSLQTKTVSAALLAELADWIDESYRAIAPKTLVKALDARPARQGARR